MVSDFPLLLYAWTDLKYIFLDLVCRKGLALKKCMASSTLLWCLATKGCKGIRGMVVLWDPSYFLYLYDGYLGAIYAF